MNSFEQAGHSPEPPEEQPLEPETASIRERFRESRDNPAWNRMIWDLDPSEEELFLERTGRWPEGSETIRPLTPEEQQRVDGIASIEPTGDPLTDVFRLEEAIYPSMRNRKIPPLYPNTDRHAFHILWASWQSLILRGAAPPARAYWNRQSLLGKQRGELRPEDECYYEALVEAQLTALQKLLHHYGMDVAHQNELLAEMDLWVKRKGQKEEEEESPENQDLAAA